MRIDASFGDPSAVVRCVEETSFRFEHPDESQLVLPIFGEEPFPLGRDIVFSVKPEYSEKIVRGLKTVELRRRFPMNVPAGTIALFYTTTPTRALTGIAEIQEVVKRSPKNIWNEFSSEACISEKDFNTYFTGAEVGIVIKLRRARRLRRSLDLDELREQSTSSLRNRSCTRRGNCERHLVMSAPKYLIDTNVLIGLEDLQEVSPEFASLVQLATKHGVGVFIHEAARDDLARDANEIRRRITLSKAAKFPLIGKVRGLTKDQLETEFGVLSRPNDVVDATLLHALKLGVADFVVTQDRGLHDRARRYVPDLVRRVLYVADAALLLRSTYEPVDVRLRFVEETDAHTIPIGDPIFDSLRKGYPDFDRWWVRNA